MDRRHWGAALIAALLALAPAAAWARSTMHDYDIQSALESDLGKEKLLDVPVYFAGQSHPAVASDLGEFKANRSTNAFAKSDASACRTAFLSAVISLQTRARREGGNAVIDVKSITKHQDLESATQYRCAAGSVIANVVLTGRVVRIER